MRKKGIQNMEQRSHFGLKLSDRGPKGRGSRKLNYFQDVFRSVLGGECLGWEVSWVGNALGVEWLGCRESWVWSALGVQSLGSVECLGCGSIVNAGSDVGVEVQVF